VSNFTKIRSVGAELFHTDGQTDKMKLTVAFRNFANAPKRSCFVSADGEYVFTKMFDSEFIRALRQLLFQHV
jgi:hypothetical protein